MNSATSAGEAEVATRPPVARRKASRRRCEKEPTQTRSWLPVRSTQLGQGPRPPTADLMSMLKRHVGERLEQLGHRGYGVLPGDAGGRTSSAVSRRELALAVGDPVERLVVEGQQHAVAGRVHVGLEVVVAQRDRVRGRRAGCSRRRGSRGAAPRRGGPSRSPSPAGRAPSRGSRTRSLARGSPPGVLRGHASSIHRHAAMVLPNRRPTWTIRVPTQTPRCGGVPCETWTR